MKKKICFILLVLGILSMIGCDRKKEILPDRFDLREEKSLFAVRNQGDEATCWAHAAMGALESSLPKEAAKAYSVSHMTRDNAFHLPVVAGGDYIMSMAYFLSWQGPVMEGQTEPDLHLQEIRLLPPRDYVAIKKAVSTVGGVQSAIYMSMLDGESADYRKDTCSYYYDGEKEPNHDIVIIGWDDHYSKDNFAHPPKNDGAFLCVNSWGRDFGEDGYFYVSYEDTTIGVTSLSYTGIDQKNIYQNIYQTDRCGWVGQLGFSSEEAYFSNVYTTRKDEVLSAVGFYATDRNSTYEVYVAVEEEAKDTSPVGVLKEEDRSAFLEHRELLAKGSLSDAGFYTVPLKKEMNLSAGTRFAVIVKLRTKSSVHPIAIEYNSTEKDYTVDLTDGEGYVSKDGKTWESAELELNCNVCLKAYTK